MPLDTYVIHMYNLLYNCIKLCDCIIFPRSYIQSYNEYMIVSYMRSCNICVFEMYHKGVSCMCNILKKLGEAELEIMQVIWNSKGPVTSNYILKELQGRRKWQLSTLMTSLASLADKGFVSCDRSSGSNLYTSVISENEYKTGASRRFLEKLYNNSLQNMVATLYNNKAIKSSDVEELRNFLDELEAEHSGEDDR